MNKESNQNVKKTQLSENKIYIFRSPIAKWLLCFPASIFLLHLALLAIFSSIWPIIWRMLFVKIIAYSIFAPLFWFLYKEMFIVILSREGILSGANFLPWEKIKNVKRGQYFGATYLTFNHVLSYSNRIQIRLKESQLAGFKFAVETLSKEWGLPTQTIIDSLLDVVSSEATSGGQNRGKYSIDRILFTSRIKKYFSFILIFGSFVLMNQKAAIYLFRNPVGQRIFNFITNTTNVAEGEIYFGVSWPEGTLIHRNFENNEPSYVETKKGGDFLHGRWPKDTYFHYIDGVLSFAIVQDDFELGDVKFPKGSHVRFRDTNIESVYLSGNWNFKGKTYNQSQTIIFKDNLPDSIRTKDCKTVRLDRVRARSSSALPCTKKVPTAMDK